MSTGLLARLEINLERRRQLCMESEVVSRESASENAGMLSQAANERYRCPENFFEIFLSDQLSSDDRFFRFGPNTICYGRSCSGERQSRVEASLYDAMLDVIVEGGKLGLPFESIIFVWSDMRMPGAWRAASRIFFENCTTTCDHSQI